MNTIGNTTDHRLTVTFDTLRLGAIAGAAGGIAEIAWVSFYAAISGANPAMVARGVTTATGANTLLPADAAAVGIALHMTIAVALGVALAFIWRALTATRTVNPFAFMTVALAGVWAINFFVVLPIVSPAFTQLLPYSVSLVSKLAFGMAAASVLRHLASPSLTLQRARHSSRA
jgi:hypothetical protein